MNNSEVHKLMKFRTDFVTNSSSSSFITVSIVNDDKVVSEEFRVYDSSKAFGRYNDVSILKDAVSGEEILDNLGSFFAGGNENHTLTEKSGKIKEITSLDGSFVKIEQVLRYDNGLGTLYTLNGFAKNRQLFSYQDGDIINNLKRMVELRDHPVEAEIKFDRLRNLPKAIETVEKLKIGDRLKIEYDQFGQTVKHKAAIVGRLPESANASSYRDMAEIIGLTPLSKRRKGSKYNKSINEDGL